MGLDNGIILKTRRPLVDADFYNEENERMILSHDMWRMPVEPNEDGWYEYEICYWRKCWNIRERILNILGGDRGDIGGGYYEDLTTTDILGISDAIYLLLYNGAEHWRDSIWEFEEVVPNLGADIAKLGWLVRFMEKNAMSCEVEFYDSY